jgi:S-DNA-T family DNA segregation ATPase FtsK/SpoIIIE
VAKAERHHGPWVTEDEINAVMKYWSEQGAPEYDESAMRAIAREAVYGQGNGGSAEEDGGDGDHDERYDEILAWVSGLKSVSASLVQRKFRLGYPRAARMIELFEKEGVVGPANGSKPREVLVRSYDDKSV